MTVYVKDLIEVVAQLCEQRHLRATMKHTLKGSVITGLSAALAGFVFGPVGLAIGGVLGGVGSSVAYAGKFRSVGTILKDMSPKEKQQLFDRISYAFRNIGYKEIATVITMLLSAPNLQEVALKEVCNFLHSQMNLQIM